MFSLEIVNALIYAIMPAFRGIPSKRKPSEAVKPPPRSAAKSTPVDDVQYDNIDHWPVLVSDEKRCRLCQSYGQMTCQKCILTLCLLQDRNSFIAFHTWKVPMLILLHSFILRLYNLLDYNNKSYSY